MVPKSSSNFVQDIVVLSCDPRFWSCATAPCLCPAQNCVCPHGWFCFSAESFKDKEQAGQLGLTLSSEKSFSAKQINYQCAQVEDILLKYKQLIRSFEDSSTVLSVTLKTLVKVEESLAKKLTADVSSILTFGYDGGSTLTKGMTLQGKLQEASEKLQSLKPIILSLNSKDGESASARFLCDAVKKASAKNVIVAGVIRDMVTTRACSEFLKNKTYYHVALCLNYTPMDTDQQAVIDMGVSKMDEGSASATQIRIFTKVVVDKARGGDHQKYNKELVVDFRILIIAAKAVVFLSIEFESEKCDLVKVCEVDSDSEESALDEVTCAKDRLTTRANGQFCKALTTMNTGRDVMRRATKYTDTVNADRTARIEVDALPSLIVCLAVDELDGSQRSDWEKVYCKIMQLQATSSKRFLKRMDTMEVITSFAIKACTLAENATLGSLNDFVAKCSALSELVIASIGSRSEPSDLRTQIADMAVACDKALQTGAQFGLDKMMKSDLYEAHESCGTMPQLRR